MAKLSNDHTYVTVEWGDTLSQIAVDYKAYSGGATCQQLAAINGIPNPNLIRVGQRIQLVDIGTPAPVEQAVTKVTINQFGLQSNANNVLFVTWDWSRSNTDHYEVHWLYATGDGVWFIGSETQVSKSYKQSTYTIPSNATKVAVKIKPVSKTYTKNNKKTKYWTGDWCDKRKYYVANSPPVTPSSPPSIEIENFILTAEINNIDATALRATHVQFQIVKDDTAVYATINAAINTTTNYVSCTTAVGAGSEYKVRCRTYRGNDYSDWTSFSGNESTIPSAPSGISSVKALSSTAVSIDWNRVNNATGYEVQYTTDKSYFDSNSSEVRTVTVGEGITNAKITGMESGKEYFFRVKATNAKGSSSWTPYASIIIGKNPSAPTTWSSTTTVITGEELILYWVHNAEDNSYQTYAEVELYINGVKSVHTITTSADEETAEPTYTFAINTGTYVEGVEIKWRVRTAGITKTYGDWSVERVVTVYSPPTLELNVMYNSDGTNAFAFPILISALAGPNTQVPISYSLVVTSNDTYETVDNIGNPKIVKMGDPVYTKHFDTSKPLSVKLSANDLDLENNMSYTITCTVAMDSGLTAEKSSNFTVNWKDDYYYPNAEIMIDQESLVAHIHPYCENVSTIIHLVEKVNNDYVVSSERINRVYGTEVNNVYTTTGEQVYYGTTAQGDVIYYCYITKGVLVSGVTLSVYRREFDGSFTEIATGIKNTNNTFVTDPHPALDYARYRIVAITEDTGTVSYYDMPGEPIGGTAVVIQWAEVWSQFDISSEDELVQPPWEGSLLKLPYNINISDNSKPDVEIVEYIGREHPVSYYGTQVGQTATWTVDVPFNDAETIYALRRLQRWMGDVYVREPSGSGYWANISVAFSQKHRNVYVPVTMNVTRVEGGK